MISKNFKTFQQHPCLWHLHDNGHHIGEARYIASRCCYAVVVRDAVHGVLRATGDSIYQAVVNAYLSGNCVIGD